MTRKLANPANPRLTAGLLPTLSMTIAAFAACPTQAAPISQNLPSPPDTAPVRTVPQTTHRPHTPPTNFLGLGAVVHGPSIPMGFRDFCGRYPDECSGARAPERVVMTDTRMSELARVDRAVNSGFTPSTDPQIFGTIEHWEFISQTGAGDCEDFTLEKKRRLEALGWPPSSLLLAFVRHENDTDTWHLVLIARTDKGDYLLDNLRASPSLWHQAPYRWVSLQAPESPGKWREVTKAQRPHSAAKPINIQVFPDP